MTIEEEKLPIVDIELLEEPENDIDFILKKSGYMNAHTGNGITLGVRFQGIKGTRGVHVDVVHILDLRTIRYTKAEFALKSTVLQAVNKDVRAIFEKLGKEDRYIVKTVWTAKGRIRLEMLRSKNLSRCSLIHQTRRVLVVIPDMGTTVDFSWLLDKGHLVRINELAMKLSGNILSSGSLTDFLTVEKWDALQKGYARGYWGMLGLVLSAVGTFSFIAGMVSGSFLLGLLAILSGLLVAVFFLSSARSLISEFIEAVSNERKLLAEESDSNRIQIAFNTIENDKHTIDILKTPLLSLMIRAGNAILSCDFDTAVKEGRDVIYECANVSPLVWDEDGEYKHSSTEMKRFLGLFKHLGVETSTTNLSLAYMGLTGHTVTPLRYEEIIEYIGTLNQSLYESGILEPNSKESIDDMLNNRGVWLFIRKLCEEEKKESTSEPKESDTPIPKEPELIDKVMPEIMEDEEPVEDYAPRTGVEAVHYSIKHRSGEYIEQQIEEESESTEA